MRAATGDVEVKAQKTRLTERRWGQPIEVDEPARPRADEPTTRSRSPRSRRARRARSPRRRPKQSSSTRRCPGGSRRELPMARTRRAMRRRATRIDDGRGRSDRGRRAEAEEELWRRAADDGRRRWTRQLKHLVEALVFAADKPVTVQRLRQLTRVSDIEAARGRARRARGRLRASAASRCSRSRAATSSARTRSTRRGSSS